jgi:hypothetical protein
MSSAPGADVNAEAISLACGILLTTSRVRKFLLSIYRLLAFSIVFVSSDTFYHIAVCQCVKNVMLVVCVDVKINVDLLVCSQVNKECDLPTSYQCYICNIYTLKRMYAYLNVKRVNKEKNS